MNKIFKSPSLDSPLKGQIKTLRKKNNALTHEERLDLKSKIENQLIFQTLYYASHHIPHFRDLLSKDNFQLDQSITKKQLQQLPLMNRKVLIEEIDALINPNCLITTMKKTSGMYGPRLRVFQSYEEMQVCSVFPEWDDFPFDNLRGSDILLTLYPSTRIVAPKSFYNLDIPEFTLLYSVFFKPHFHELRYDAIIDHLLDRYPFKRKNHLISLLHIFPSHYIRELTSVLKRRGYDPPDLGIRKIYLSGGEITKRLRRIVKNDWDTEMQGYYFCTEMNSLGKECPIHADRYHFDPGTIIEILDPSTQKPVPQGAEGLLAITPCYPFHQAQFLIRYLNGDLARSCADLCECGFCGDSFEFRGRYEHSLGMTDIIPENKHMRYISSLDILNILTDFDEIPYIYYPVYALERKSEAQSIRITLQVEMNPPLEKAKEEGLKRKILSRLYETYKEWQSEIQQKSIDFQIKFVPAGSINDCFFAKPD